MGNIVAGKGSAKRTAKVKGIASYSLARRGTDPERVRHEYFFAASDYYVAGRFAFFTNAFNVCGNLLHHAIELYLKGHLWSTVPREELKDDLKHNLPKIWKRFKVTTGDSRLAAFDRTIRDVHAFECLRYPESIIETGWVFHFELTRTDLNRSRAADKGLGNRPVYLLALEELDQLIHLLFDVCGLTPEVFLRGWLGDARRHQYLLQSNSAWKAMDVINGDHDV